MTKDEHSKKDESNDNELNSNKFINFLQLFTEVMAWIFIVISLSFFTGLISIIVYLIISGKSGFVIALIIEILGVFTSIFYACYIWKTKGTVNFISNSSWKYNNIRDNP